MPLQIQICFQVISLVEHEPGFFYQLAILAHHIWTYWHITSGHKNREALFTCFHGQVDVEFLARVKEEKNTFYLVWPGTACRWIHSQIRHGMLISRSIRLHVSISFLQRVYIDVEISELTLPLASELYKRVGIG